MKAFGVLVKSYKWWVIAVTVLGLAANILALLVPKLSAQVIDQVVASSSANVTLLIIVATLTLIIAIIQIVASTYFSEKIALDLRAKLITKMSGQTFNYIAMSTPGRLLTVATSDVDAVKNVIAQGLVTLLGAVVTLIGSAIFLLFINAKLALATLAVVPFLILTFALIFGKIAALFKQGQENIEKINAVINETIIGAALIRVLHAASFEIKNFMKINATSRDIGLAVVKNISALIPIIVLLSNISTMIIVWFGGKQVIAGTLSVGNFSAFLQYSAMFIWPLFILSFVGTMISRGGVSLKRINEVLDASVKEKEGTYEGEIKGAVEFKNVSLRYMDTGGTERTVLKNISFTINPGTKNAIVGPTAAGKTQLFYLMAGLVEPSEGSIEIDGRPITSYKTSTLLSNIGLVFQDSIIFNTTLHDNIALSGKTSTEILTKALRTAELDQLVTSLPQGMETMVSERGTSLSGGQKQRLMLARALAVNPRILLLDDFTARVDQATEASILSNVAQNYPNVTLISITQKVEPIKDYDKIIVVMESELVACGTHAELLDESFEYKQIYESQQSTETLTK